MRNDYGWVSADEPFTARTSQDPMKSNPLSSRTPSPPLKDDMRRNTTPDGEGYTTPRKPHAREMYVDGSEDERIVPHGEQREPRTRSNGPDGQREPPQSSFFLQLRCTLVRVLLLMWRNRVVVILETVIPILLVLATVGLWKAFSDANNAAADYFDASTPAVYEDVVQQLRSGMCHNADVGVIAGTPACDFSGTTALYCPTGRGVPAGLCYPHALVSAVMSIGKLFQGNTSLVPTFDDIVALHWCNLDSEYVTRTSGDDVSALTSGGMLYFAPNTPAVQGLVQHLSTTTTFFNAVNGGVFDSADAALQHVKKLTYLDAPTWAIVQVDSMSTSSFDVTLRLNSTAVPSASDAVEPFYLGGLVDSGNTPYLLSGFTTLQTAVYDYYMAKVLGAPTASLSLSYTPMPTRAYKDQGFMQNGRSFAPFIITIGFLYPMSQRAKRIVMEKESHIREALLIMGLSEIVMYCAWFLVYTVQAVIISLVIALIMVTTYLPDTGFFVVFFMFLFFALAAVSLSFAIAALFSRARMAAMMAPLIYYVMALPLFIVPSASSSTQTGLLVLPPSALSVGINLLFQHEMTGGASASTLTASSDDPNLLVVYIVLFFDILIYLVVMMYLNLAIVSGGGAFFFVAWIKRCVGHGEEESTEDGRAEKGVFEDEQRSAGVPTVTLTGLRKTFSSGRGPFVAVNNLHWSMREGEISVLLGHNGAGKTTTMNMITGMLRADSGDCVIYGKSVRDDLTGARQYIGFCPQHNVLWPELTCREHLWYFASIKGLSGAACDEAVERMLKTVGLQEKANSFIPTLSGGQMRKLSLAIAFVGGSPLVLLDEPTAGMDVVARRQTWELLRQMTADHTILLTTHFMDEADLLGDSIGIMSQGRMQCSGSNMFLKSKLGVGYVLTMSVRMHAPRGPLESLVRRYVPDMEDKLSGAGEAAYRLPMHAKSAFPKLLTAVEDASASLGIEAYSLSATTLEDVFLSIAGGSAEHGGEEGDASAAAANGEVNRAAASSAVWNVEIVQGRSELLWMQFRAMMVKRLCNLRRDRRTQFFQVVCPIVCVIIAMLLTKVTSSTPSAFALSSSKYHGTVEVPLAQCSGVLKASALGSNVQPLEWSGITDGAAFSSRLMDTYNSHSKARYSGLSCGSTGTTNAAFYNSSAEHSVGIATADFYNALLQQVLPGTPRMQTTSQTLPLTSEQVKANKAITLSNMALLIMVPLSMVPSTYISWVVRERQCKARHLQNVSGLNFYVYWLSNLLFDFCTYLVTMFLIIIVLLIFDCTALVGSSTIGATIVLMLLYGMASILMAYMLSFAFEDANRAQSLMTLLNFFLGFILTIVVQVLASISSTESAARTISYFFSVVPTFSLSNGLRLMSTLHMAQVYGYTTSVWSMDVVGWSCVYLGIEIPIFLVVAFFLDHPGRKQRMQRMFNGNAEPEAIADEDPDVVAERAAVQHSAERADDLVRVQALRKEYEDGKVAVRNVTFGIRPGEVFGFLGTNGAGKTTTIAILCQELYPTSGFASICGHDIVNDSQAALRCIGYCPQFDACLQLLTVREHLNLYAGVRGIAPSSLDGAVEGLMQMFELKPYEDTQSDQLSGGNRRKLSVAISLLGGPRVVLLDEPSAGMDPVARRGLWTAIESMADNCAVVLTTHHLEEVDALAHRVAIMVDGTLRCIGDKTYLKQKFGSGTEVVVRLRQDEQRFAESEKRVAATEAFFQRTFPESRLVEARYDRLTFEMPTSVKLSAVFTQLEENSESMGFVDYSVSQTSLEQVFLHISEDAARKAEEEDHQKQLRERKLAQQRRCFSCLRKKPATDDEDEE